MRKYLTQTVPYELVKCLSRLNAVSDSSWTLYYSAPDSKIRATALTLAGKTAKDIIDIVTNNKPLVDEAFKLASASASSSDDYEEESSEQYQEQEEGDDDIEDNDNNVLSEQNNRTEEAQ
jgi:serine phosphatase RsbU (regulator of sigma subunit)